MCDYQMFELTDDVWCEDEDRYILDHNTTKRCESIGEVKESLLSSPNPVYVNVTEYCRDENGELEMVEPMSGEEFLAAL